MASTNAADPSPSPLCKPDDACSNGAHIVSTSWLSRYAAPPGRRRQPALSMRIVSWQNWSKNCPLGLLDLMRHHRLDLWHDRASKQRKVHMRCLFDGPPITHIVDTSARATPGRSHPPWPFLTKAQGSGAGAMSCHRTHGTFRLD